MQNYKSFFLVFIVFSISLFGDPLVPKSIEVKAGEKYGPYATNRFRSLNKKLLHEIRQYNKMKQLNIVNTWVNQLRYKSDIENYGVSDYWATLYEFVGKNEGDCEDYTITKYYILKELGFDPKRMKFTYVVYKDREGRDVSHMVLSYFKVPKPKSRDDILILDNNNLLILPASKRTDLIKVIKMINGDTGPKSKKWKKLEINMKRKKL